MQREHDPDALLKRAQASCQEGRFAEGVALARRALALAPRQAKTLVLLGRALAQFGETGEALATFDQAIACAPDSADAHGNRGDVLAGLGRLAEAVQSYQRALELAPNSIVNWCNLGAAQAGLGQLADALASYDRVIALEPAFAEAHGNKGNVLALLGRDEEAIAAYDTTLGFTPDNLDVLGNRGSVLLRLGRADAALAGYERMLALTPGLAQALSGRSAALTALGRSADALASIDAALAAEPSNADALSNHGYLLRSLGRHDEALASLDRALAIDPNHAGALGNRGAVLSDLGRYAEAVASFDRSIALAPTDAGAHCNRAKALFALQRHNEALAAAERALAADPGHAEAHYTRGLVLVRLGRHDEAIVEFDRVLECDPRHPHALAQLAACCLWICDWDRLATVKAGLAAAMAAGSVIVSPHILLQLARDPAEVLQATRHYVACEMPPGPTLAGRAEVSAGRIRVAYLSGDFRVHPVAYLMAELFERHDRRRFEIVGLSFGPDDKSSLRSRLARSFDGFHDMAAASDREIAALIRKLGVDIAVDLGGHTENARSGALQYRPAPVQAQYLGYPGTMGVDFIDYIIADRIVLPFDQQPHYAERIVHLPDCFLVNDATRAISAVTPSRAQAALPEHGFVFCCFNNSAKISADVFAIWLRLLAKVDGSVLWLSGMNACATENLRAAARAGGVDPRRIVFAPRMASMADHLARLRLADLFLDTPVYNAHTTASDALWAGLPVLTLLGTAFPGRVAASLLHAVGLPALVTTSLPDYEALALTLANDPGRLAAIRLKLDENRLHAPLFDTDRFRRHIEEAYLTMARIARQGGPPRSFAVEPIERS